MDSVGLDMLLDIHGDEELPYNFINGNEVTNCLAMHASPQRLFSLSAALAVTSQSCELVPAESQAPVLATILTLKRTGSSVAHMGEQSCLWVCENASFSAAPQQNHFCRCICDAGHPLLGRAISPAAENFC